MGRNKKQLSPADKKRNFIKHFRLYLVISIFLVLLNVTTSNEFWAIWPIMGWGIGVAIEGLSVFGPLRDREDEYESDEFFDLDHNRPDIKTPTARPNAAPRGFNEDDLV